MARPGVETARERLTRERVAENAAEVECHELFMVHDDDDLPIASSTVAFISITRLAPTRENAGRAWDSATLLNPDAVRMTFGGGTYQIRALTAKRHPIPGGTRHYQFSGESYPMDGSGPPKPVEPVQSAPAAPVQPIYQPPPPQPNLSGLADIMRPLVDQLSAANARADALMLKLVELASRPSGPAPAAEPAQAVTPEQLEAAAEAHLGRFLDGFKQAQQMLSDQYKMIEAAKKEAREEGKADAAGGDGEIALLREALPIFGPMLSGGKKD